LIDVLFQIPGPGVELSSDDAGASATAQRLREFGWTLFLVAKTMILPSPPQFQDAFHMLVCCVELVYVLAPPHCRKVSPQLLLRDLQQSELRQSAVAHQAVNPRRSIPHTGAPTVLEAICLLAKVGLPDVSRQQASLFVPLLQHLQQQLTLVFDESSSGSGDSKSQHRSRRAKGSSQHAYLFFEGLLDSPASQTANLAAIRAEYEILYSDGKTGGIDERPWSAARAPRSDLTAADLLSANSLAFTEADSDRRESGVTSVTSSSSSSSATPAQSAGLTVGWLRKKVPGANISPAPSSDLLKMMRKCGESTASEIARFVDARIALLAEKMPGAGQDRASKAGMAGKLFYFVLEEMIRAETARLG
jgi:Domain of unknown function (DUF3452)/Retinoblastoma-associated protein A domain